MANKQLKFNRNFFKDIQFWIGLAVLVMGFYSLIGEQITNIYFWMNILMGILGLVTVIDDLILHRRPANN
ncbi:hypothetical protein [Secundilactobacillus folii]|uniref:Uncharacterized protein n=1 Tax=Secundilactobacillus folii TaxID=2678357 RepID=A0A7X2XU76_9LACO|nr:hypothetical protein [Secundilactobacillus folii]MTV81678.1 hypothetical protein [Secundilactobacillus folii]